MNLDTVSVRVLGALMEKEITTPDLYPLSINALLSACNQRSSRDPVMDLTDEEVRGGLDVLRAHELVAGARDGGRVPRFEHRARTVLNLRRDETALLCLLLLRGGQTPGELRSRADRLFTFEDLASVQTALDRLASREEPLCAALPRAPGSRETRYIHLLGGAATVATAAGGPRGASPEEQRSPIDNPMQRPVDIGGLWAEMEKLSRRVAILESRLQIAGEIKTGESGATETGGTVAVE